MKQFRRFLWALLLMGMAIAIYSSAVGETAPEKINWGGAEPAAGSWARTADAMEFSYPMDAARDEPTILLRSAWQKYQVLVAVVQRVPSCNPRCILAAGAASSG